MPNVSEFLMKLNILKKTPKRFFFSNLEKFRIDSVNINRIQGAHPNFNQYAIDSLPFF